MKDSYSFYKDKLNREYKACFEQVEAYGLAQNLGTDKWEERMMELLDVFLSAQNEKKPVEKIVGADVTKFCDHFYSQFSGLDYLKGFADAVKRCCWVILIFTVFDVIALWEDGSFWELTSEAGSVWIGFFFGMISSYLTAVVVRVWMHHFKKLSMRMYHVMSAIQFVVLIALVVSLTILLDSWEIRVPCWMLLVFCAVYLALYYLCMRKERGRRGKILFRDMVAELVPDTLIQEFEKKNRKRQKAGKPLMTEMEFIDERMSRYEKSRKMSKWCLVFVVGFFLLGILVTWTHEGFESPGDFVFFVVLETGGAALFGLPPYLLFNRADEAQNRWLEESKAQGSFVRKDSEPKEAKDACNSAENGIE